MTANVEAMIRAGVEAYRAGNRIEARALLERAIEIDDYNEDAWLWLSAVVETKDEQRTCLENVLVINPENERAQAGLKALGPVAPPEPTEPESPFSAADNTTPFSDFNFDEDDDSSFSSDASSTPETSPPAKEWDDTIATSSASSSYKGPQLTSDDYDSWMSSLNIGTQGNSEPPANSNIFKEEEDPFDVFNQTDFTDSGTSFNTFDFDEPEESTPEPPTASTQSYTPDFADDFDNYLDTFDGDEDADDSFDNRGLTDLSRDSSLDALSDPSSADFLFSDDEEEDSLEADPREMFSLIPPSVTATRLPGTVESVSAGLKVGVALLVLLNIGAIAAIVMQVI